MDYAKIYKLCFEIHNLIQMAVVAEKDSEVQDKIMSEVNASLLILKNSINLE